MKSYFFRQLFEKLRRDSPGELSKIIPVAGDVTEPELGISANDQDMLIRSVSVVFHSAATVKFDEALKLSVTINMLGTKRLVQLCHRMRNVEVREIYFLHPYSNRNVEPRLIYRSYYYSNQSRLRDSHCPSVNLILYECAPLRKITASFFYGRLHLYSIERYVLENLLNTSFRLLMAYDVDF